MSRSEHLSGAEYMASIFGTEKDMVNCPFFYKIGACRNGAKCKRLHNKPTFSQTVLLKNLYHNPKLAQDVGLSQYQIAANAAGSVGVTEAEEQSHFDDFFEEIFVEVEDAYGEVEEMNVCDNIGEHMIGNVYIKFRREEDADKCQEAVNNRWFGGEPIYAELSPVTDFREACCRQYEMGECHRGGWCNFMHLKPISYQLRKELYNRDHPWRPAVSTSAPPTPPLPPPTLIAELAAATASAATPQPSRADIQRWKRKVTAARARRVEARLEMEEWERGGGGRLPSAYTRRSSSLSESSTASTPPPASPESESYERLPAAFRPRPASSSPSPEPLPATKTNTKHSNLPPALVRQWRLKV